MSDAQLTDVLVVGAGPTGLMLAARLLQAGVDCAVVERGESIDPRTRAVMVHPVGLRLLDEIGVREAVEARGVRQRRLAFHLGGGRRFAAGPVEERDGFGYFVNVPQPVVEHVLRSRVEELGGRLFEGTTYVRHRDGARGVNATVSDAGGAPRLIACRFLVGCDGASSSVRAHLSVGFPGVTLPVAYLLGEGPQAGGSLPRDESAMYVGENGVASVLPLPDGSVRIAGPFSGEVSVDSPRAGLTEHQYRTALSALGFPAELQLTSLDRLASYAVHSRLADRFRMGRVFLAGDAAHLNPPAGGQAMNCGFGDAADLAERIIHAAAGHPGELEGYEPTRRAVAKAVAASTDVQPLLARMRAVRTQRDAQAVQQDLEELVAAWSVGRGVTEHAGSAA